MAIESGLTWAKLRDKVEGIAWKFLTSHEIDPSVSNGHEFQGINRLRELLGGEDRRGDDAFSCTYSRYEDADGAGPVEEVNAPASWYDARRAHPTRSPEWRLYYPGDAALVQQRCRTGDLMVLVKLRTGDLKVLLIEQGSTWQRKAEVLFNVEFGSAEKRTVQLSLIGTDRDLPFAVAEIAQEFGLVSPDELMPSDEGITDLANWLITTSPDRLPSGKLISSRVRDATNPTFILDLPDEALVGWMEREEAVFRMWEKAKVQRWLEAHGHGTVDVESFLSFSMSVFQTRKSRAGGAFQNHVAAIFDRFGLRYAAQAITENRERPDFLFPDAESYHNLSFPESRLRLLGVKTTAKDRFRQVLHEGHRITRKHLLTLEAGISEVQTHNMRVSNLQLIVPSPIRCTYTEAQQEWIWTLSDFIKDVQATQK